MGRPLPAPGSSDRSALALSGLIRLRTIHRLVIFSVATLLACMPRSSGELSRDRLVVAWTPLSAGEGVDEPTLRTANDRFEEALSRAEEEGTALELREVSAPEAGAGDNARRAAAEALIQQSKPGHYFLWGELRHSAAGTAYHLNLTTLEDPKDTESSIAPASPGFKTTTPLDPFGADALAELTPLLRGLAAVHTMDWEAALGAFEELKTPPIRAVLAGALFKPEQLGEFSADELTAAAQMAADAFNSAPPDTPPHTASALHLAHATALYILGERLRGQACVEPLEASALNFGEYLESLPGEAAAEAHASGYMGLGNAMLRLGQRGEGAGSLRYLNGAIEAYRQAANHRSREKWPHRWADVHFQMALAQQELGRRMPGPQGLQFLQDAARSFHRVLEVETQAEAPMSWAACQANLGETYFAMGQHSQPDDADQHFFNSTLAYGRALEVFTRGDHEGAWARTNEYLGISYSALGENMEGEEAIDHLLSGIEALSRVLEVATPETNPDMWAMTQSNLAKTQLSLGEKSIDPTAAQEAFGQAVQSSFAALRVFKPDNQPRAWAIAQQNLGVACTRLAQQSEDEAALAYAERAIEAFRRILEIRDRETAPREWGVSQWNLAEALLLQGRLEQGEGAATRLRAAVEATRKALEVFSREDEPVEYARIQLEKGAALGFLAEVTTDREESRKALDEAAWALSQAMAALPQEGAGDLREQLRERLDAIQRQRQIAFGE